jgi:hypothetical protein
VFEDVGRGTEIMGCKVHFGIGGCAHHARTSRHAGGYGFFGMDWG